MACESKDKSQIPERKIQKYKVIDPSPIKDSIMKKLLLTLGLIALTFGSALAQGTIQFVNNSSSRASMPDGGGGTGRFLTVTDGFVFTAWFGPAGSTDLVQAPGEFGIRADNPGIIDAPSVFALPGTEPGQVVSLQIRMRNPVGWYGATRIAQVTLGETTVASAVIWQSAAGTNPSRFGPLIVTVPEPSTLALGALAGAFLIFRLRKPNTTDCSKSQSNS